MQVGNVVEIVDWKGSKPDNRKHGTVIRIQGKHRWSVDKRVDSKKDVLAEVLWQDGHRGWVLASRLDKATVD